MTSAIQVQRRRGTASQCVGMTPADGEIIVNSTNKRLHLGDGLLAGGMPIPNIQDITKQNFIYCAATVPVSNNAIILASKIDALVEGAAIQFKAPATIAAGGVTVNLNGTGVIDLLKPSSATLVPLDATDLIAGFIYSAVFDGTQYQLAGTVAGHNNGGLVLLQTAGPSSGVIDLTTGFSSDYGSYRVVYECTMSSGLEMRYSQDNGATFVANAYTNTFNGGTTTTGGTGATIASGTGFQMGEVKVYDSFASGYGTRDFINDGYASSLPVKSYGQRVDGSGVPITGLRLISPGGSISAGRASLYGMRV